MIRENGAVDTKKRQVGRWERVLQVCSKYTPSFNNKAYNMRRITPPLLSKKKRWARGKGPKVLPCLLPPPSKAVLSMVVPLRYYFGLSDQTAISFTTGNIYCQQNSKLTVITFGLSQNCKTMKRWDHLPYLKRTVFCLEVLCSWKKNASKRATHSAMLCNG